MDIALTILRWLICHKNKPTLKILFEMLFALMLKRVRNNTLPCGTPSSWFFFKSK